MSIKHLERKRNRLLRSKPPIATLRILLPKIDSMLQILQQKLVDIAALKAGDTWREKGEKSAGYLKRLHQTRTSQQYMASLQAPDSCRDDAVTRVEVNSAVVSGDSLTNAAQGDLGGTGMAYGDAGDTGTPGGVGDTNGAGVLDDTEDISVNQDETRLSLDGLSTDSSDDDFE